MTGYLLRKQLLVFDKNSVLILFSLVVFSEVNSEALLEIVCCA